MLTAQIQKAGRVSKPSPTDAGIRALPIDLRGQEGRPVVGIGNAVPLARIGEDGELRELLATALAHLFRELAMEVGEEAEGAGFAPLLAHEQQGNMRRQQEGRVEAPEESGGREARKAVAESAIADLIVVLKEVDEHGGRKMGAGPATRLAGRVLSALVFAAATVAAVSLVAFTVYGVRMVPWRTVALGSTLLVGCIPFALLGIAFGYWLSPRAALPVANLLYLPLAIGGFLWTRPTEDVPRSVDIASQMLPTRSWMEVLDPVATGDHPVPLHHVAALTAWGLVFLALAWWGYRRDEGERFT